MKDIDNMIDNIKSTFKAITDLLREIDEQRENDKKEFDKRLSRLEYHVYSK